MRSMRATDKRVFRGIVTAVALGTLGMSVVAGTLARQAAKSADALGTGLAHPMLAAPAGGGTPAPATAAVPHTAPPDDTPERGSASGFPVAGSGANGSAGANGAVGTTTVTGATLGSRASRIGDPTGRGDSSSTGGAAATAGASTPGTVPRFGNAGAVPAATAPTVTAPAGTATPTAAPTATTSAAVTTPTPASADAGAAPAARTAAGAPAASATIGAGGFATEAPSWGASAFEGNPDAGAGPFTTDRSTR